MHGQWFRVFNRSSRATVFKQIVLKRLQVGTKPIGYARVFREYIILFTDVRFQAEQGGFRFSTLAPDGRHRQVQFLFSLAYGL